MEGLNEQELNLDVRPWLLFAQKLITAAHVVRYRLAKSAKVNAAESSA
ncbi:MAG: hypothetical protein H6623_03390 [Bdellovibrionaceae bacterium]|nr:hypothetical protein [Pseudobdellovibrionaceae bacterium]